MRFSVIISAMAMTVPALGAPKIETGILRPGDVKPNTPRQLLVNIVGRYRNRGLFTLLFSILLVLIRIWSRADYGYEEADELFQCAPTPIEVAGMQTHSFENFWNSCFTLVTFWQACRIRRTEIRTNSQLIVEQIVLRQLPFAVNALVKLDVSRWSSLTRILNTKFPLSVYCLCRLPWPRSRSPKSCQLCIWM